MTSSLINIKTKSSVCVKSQSCKLLKGSYLPLNYSQGTNQQTPFQLKESKIITEMIPARNPIGSNNCFINVILQMLHNAPLFRNFILNSKNLQLDLFLRIKELFFKYKELSKQLPSNELSFAIDVTNIRKELCKIFPSCSLNIAGDPIDAFLNLMTVFHSFQVKAKDLSEDISEKCNPSCPAHSYFALKLTEKISCPRCQKTSLNNYDNNYYVYEVYSWEIMDCIKSLTSNQIYRKLFEKINIVSSSLDQSIKFCTCPDQSLISRKIILRENPLYIMIHLTWNMYDLVVSDIFKMYTMIPLTATNSSLFEICKGTEIKTYELNSIIAFYGGHYISCLKSTKENKWHFGDDMVIKEFNNFTQLISYLAKNHYVPIVLCYSLYSSKTIKPEHINEKEFQSIYSSCCSKAMNQEKNVKLDNKSLFTSSVSNLSFSTFQKRNGSFSRFSSIYQDNNTQVSKDKNLLKCIFCNQMNSSELIRCQNCKKFLNKNSMIQQDFANENKFKKDIPMLSEIVGFDFEPVCFKKITKLELYEGANCSGYKPSMVDITNDYSLCETQYNDSFNSIPCVDKKVQEEVSHPQMPRNQIKNEISSLSESGKKNLHSSGVKSLAQSTILLNTKNNIFPKVKEENRGLNENPKRLNKKK